jgi:hypothetical protein
MSLDNNNIYLITPPSLNENEIIRKTLTLLSKQEDTPVDISSIEIESIELRHLSFIRGWFQYSYQVSATAGRYRKVYKPVQKVRTDSNGNQKIVVEEEYSHTETDWENYYDSSSYADFDMASLSLEADKFEEKVAKKIIDRYKKTEELLALVNDSEANLNLYTEIKDVSDTFIELHTIVQERMFEKIKKGIVGDTYRDLNINHDLDDFEAVVVNFPINIVKYKFKDKEYTLKFCEAIDYNDMKEEYPIDKEIREMNSDITMSWVYTLLGAIGLVFFFWLFFSDDVYYTTFNWWLIGICSSYFIFKVFVASGVNTKENKLIKEEKERRLQKKLIQLGIIE